MTAGLLLLAIGVLSLSVHHDADMVPSSASSAHSAGTADAVIVHDVASSVAPDGSSTILTAVCAFAVVCCVLLAAARFAVRRPGARPLVARAPRGSPRPVSMALTVTPRPSLSQLSISRT